MWARHYIRTSLQLCLVFCLLQIVILPLRANAITAIPTPPPQAGTYGLEATKTQPAPTTGATITIPGNGGSFSTSPTTISGTCPKDLLVQVYDNGVLVGAVNCTNGSFSVQVTLFTGTNELTAIVYDSLDQAGPTSNTVTVTYNNTSFTAFGALITLTSNYGRRAANPGTTLKWPLLLSGGTGPYAFSIDWGDGTPAELKSQALSGEVNLSHVYNKSGIFRVTVKVTDANGVSAFLQLIAISNGNVSDANGSDNTKTTAATTVTKVMWIPTIIAFVMLFPVYWLGRRSELVSLRKKMEKDVANFNKK